MIKTKSLLILISTLLFSNYYLSFSQELTITTYYPSPVGIYKELRAKRMAIGDNYYNPSKHCWWDDSCASKDIDSLADLVVEGNVGIGTTDPLEKLDVNGGIRVDDYIKARDSGGLSLKTDDGTTRLFIKDNGNVGIGTTNPGKKLEVAGSTKIGGDLNVNGDTQLGNESSDKTTVKGDLEVAGTTVLKDDVSIDEGLVVGNPTEGNKGPGTINAQKIYVDGNEIGGGGFSDCEIVEKECCGAFYIACDVSCPSDKWLIAGGGKCGKGSGGASDLEGMMESYPKTAGKGGTWHIYGIRGYVKNGVDCVKAYVLCCK